MPWQPQDDDETKDEQARRDPNLAKQPDFSGQESDPAHRPEDDNTFYDEARKARKRSTLTLRDHFVTTE